MKTEPINPDTVIVRAFEDKPVQLTVVSRRAGVVEVAGADKNKTIGFPLRLVYRFEESVFRQLEIAFRAGNKERLSSLWGQMQPFR